MTTRVPFWLQIALLVAGLFVVILVLCKVTG